MKRREPLKKKPKRSKPPRRIIHPEFERVMARLRVAFEATPLILPAPALYLALARELISEAQQLQRGSKA